MFSQQVTMRNKIIKNRNGKKSKQNLEETLQCKLLLKTTFRSQIKDPPTKCTLKSFLPILNSSLSLLHIYDQVLSHFSCVQLFVTPMDLSPPGFSVHGILQARILGWVAISFSRGYSQLRDQTHVS